jgi:type I restriction enzyme, S subunit
MNPADASRLCFAVRRGEIHERADASYMRAAQWMAEAYAQPKYPLVALDSCLIRLQYGISELATEEPIGVPILRMNNLQDDGWDLRDLKYIQLSPKEMGNYTPLGGRLRF